jgi:hypothetical protein
VSCSFLDEELFVAHRCHDVVVWHILRYVGVTRSGGWPGPDS